MRTALLFLSLTIACDPDSSEGWTADVSAFVPDDMAQPADLDTDGAVSTPADLSSCFSVVCAPRAVCIDGTWNVTTERVYLWCCTVDDGGLSCTRT